ncbi:hypothetical protein [Priestia megaterium]|uniref:hypothetical protein n=1 Tax=Priestia megaterium TaxID=1404 RepID=UPI00203C69B0|nr:hypothetical protein [Priestia megaterium]MCM3186384.1 hypothetical protein [Priestia megaterium]
MQDFKKKNQEEKELTELQNKGRRWIYFLGFLAIFQLIFTVVLKAVQVWAPQISITFVWVTFGVYAFSVLSLIVMREIVFGKTYQDLLRWMRILWVFCFIVSALGTVTMFMVNTHWTLF